MIKDVLEMGLSLFKPDFDQIKDQRNPKEIVWKDYAIIEYFRALPTQKGFKFRVADPGWN